MSQLYILAVVGVGVGRRCEEGEGKKGKKGGSELELTFFRFVVSFLAATRIPTLPSLLERRTRMLWLWMKLPSLLLDLRIRTICRLTTSTPTTRRRARELVSLVSAPSFDSFEFRADLVLVGMI